MVLPLLLPPLPTPTPLTHPPPTLPIAPPSSPTGPGVAEPGFTRHPRRVKPEQPAAAGIHREAAKWAGGVPMVAGHPTARMCASARRHPTVKMQIGELERQQQEAAS